MREQGVVAGPSPAVVEQLGDSISRLMRSFARARSQFLAATKHDVEWSAQLIISVLVREGPLRSNSLAELVQSDPSTVSRQVATLVKDGLIERRADPNDGRATLLVATEAGHDVFREHMRVRDAHFQRMLSDWNEHDCRRFATLLQRFTTAFDRHRAEFFAEGTRCEGSASPLGTTPHSDRPPADRQPRGREHR